MIFIFNFFHCIRLLFIHFSDRISQLKIVFKHHTFDVFTLCNYYYYIVDVYHRHKLFTNK